MASYGRIVREVRHRAKAGTTRSLRNRRIHASWWARFRGKGAVVQWHAKMDRRLDHLLVSLDRNKASIIQGSFPRAKRFGQLEASLFGGTTLFFTISALSELPLREIIRFSVLGPKVEHWPVSESLYLDVFFAAVCGLSGRYLYRTTFPVTKKRAISNILHGMRWHSKQKGALTPEQVRDNRSSWTRLRRIILVLRRYHASKSENEKKAQLDAF